MANVKITELGADASPASTDVLAIVDVTGDVTKKVTVADLLENAGDGNAASPAFSFDSDNNSGVFLEAADKLGFSTNGAGRIYIDGSGNVGVAKSNPTQTLDVNGTAAVSGALTQGGNNVVTVGDTGTVTGTMIADGSIVDADVNASAAIGLSKLATGALPTGISIASANIVDGSLAVSKLASATARQLLQTDAAGTGVEFTSNVDVPGTLDVTGVATFDGNVTVEGNLTVNGTTTTIDSTTLVVEDKNIEMGAVTTPSDTTADGGGITLKGATDKTLTWVNSTDCWTFNQALNLTAGTESAAALVFDADVNTGIFHPAADTIAVSTQGNERLRVTADGKINLNESAGAVGSKLNIFNGSDNQNILGITGADESTEYAAMGIQAGNAVITGGGIGSTSTGIIFRTAEGGTEVERVRFTASGNVGIGVSAPESALTVTGSFPDAITQTGVHMGTLSSGYAAMQFNHTVGGFIDFGVPDVDFGGRILYTHSSNSMAFYTNTTEKMRLTGSGNMGVGVNSPLGKLHVRAADECNLVVREESTKLVLSAETNNGRDSNRPMGLEGSQIDFTISGTEKVSINSSGFVGIGVTTPSQLLDLASTAPNIRLTDTVDGHSEIDGNAANLKFNADKGNEKADSNITFAVDNSEKVRITSAGRLGVGEDDPDSILHVGGSLNSDNFITFSKRVAANASNLPVIGQTSSDGVNNDIGICATSSGGAIRFYTGNGAGGFGAGSNAERMTISSTGQIFTNGANSASAIEAGTQAGKVFKASHAASSGSTSTGQSFHFSFANPNGFCGSISTSGSGTTFAENSDYRLKENIVNLDGAIDRVKQLAPKRFNFIADANKTVDGFLAHEAQAVVPEAVTGTKDEVDEENNPVMQGIDHSKLVPLLTAALQEAIAKIETLETKVAALEAQ